MGKKLVPALLAVVVLVAALLLWNALSRETERGSAASAPNPAVETPRPPATTATPEPAAPVELAPVALREEREERSVAPAAAEQPEAEGSIWSGETVGVEGRVRLAPGTPADEELFVFATTRERDAAGLYDGEGSGALAWREDFRPVGELVARTRAEADGSFRLELPVELEQAHLAIAGRYSYSRTTTPVEPAAGARVVLEAELGGWVTGVLRAPAGAGGPVEGIEVELGPDLTSGFDAFAIQRSAWEHHDRTDGQGRFEFRGVNDVVGHGVAVKPERFAAQHRLGIEVRPGGHETLELTLSIGGTVRGRVRDDAGEPVVGAQVRAKRPGVIGRAIGAVRETSSDEQGAFTLEHVAAGDIEIEAELAGLRPSRQRLKGSLEDGEEERGVELVLDHGLTIAGTVRYPDGSPAAAVDVSARPDFSKAGGLGWAAAANATYGSAETDEEGSYAISGLAPATYDLTARRKVEAGEREGTWKALATANAAGPETRSLDVDLTLQGLVPVLGRVVDAEGAPVTRYTVVARHATTGQFDFMGAMDRRVTEVDDEQGRFRLEDLEAGTWELELTAAGLARGLVQGLEVPRPEEAGELLVTLVPVAAVQGVVLGTGGRPVGGALVSVEVDLMTRMRRRGGEDLPKTWSDGEGRFRLELDPGDHTLVAAQEGSAGSEAYACSLSSGQVLRDVVLRLRQGGTVRGLVLDDDGDPDPGRMVIVQRTPSYSAQRMQTTDAEGRFLVEHLEPGKWQVVSTKNFMAGELAESDQEEMTNDFLGSMKMDMVDVADGEEVEVVLGGQVGDPVVVHGRVLHGGEPVEQAIVSALPEDGNGLKDMKMKPLDSDGSFEMTLPKAGNYLVTVQTTAGMGQQQSMELMETIPEGREEYELVIELPLGRIAGVVKGEDGKPLAGCRVTLNAEGASYGSNLGGHFAETVTEGDGSYSLDYLRPGSYSVAAGGVGFGGVFGGETEGGRVVRGGLRLHEGEVLDRVDFRLERPGNLEGTVVDQAGKPVAEATVFVRDERGLPLEAFSLVGTDGAGHFTYRGLAPGSYTVSAKKDAGATQESAAVRVREGETGQVRLVMGGGTILVVAGIDAEGNELGTRLSVVDSAGREYGSMRSLNEIMERMGSQFSGKSQRIGPVPPGTYVLTATADDGREVSKSFTLSDQEERRIKLRLK